MTTNSQPLHSFPEESNQWPGDQVNEKAAFPELSTFTYVSKPLVKRPRPGNIRVIVYPGSTLPGRLRGFKGDGQTSTNQDNHYSGDLEVDWGG